MAEAKSDFRDDFDIIKREEFVPVSIPDVDLMGNEFPTIRINAHAFEPGIEHMVPPAYAEHINLLISRVNKDSVRLLRPNADVESLKQQSGWGSAPGSSKVQFVPAK